jgi:PPK2 family polyphosphate:nucleotide phosphotransferase
MTPASSSIRDLLRARPDGRPLLPRIEADAHPGVTDKDEALARADDAAARLGDLQERLWAQQTRSLLVVLQGMDTSGKGGTVEHVFQGVNPAGLDVAAFKKPTEEELAHHFLWRIERRLPSPGEIVIFDRSHYEDVLVARVRGLVPEETWRARYDEIVGWERRVVASGTAIVKVYLHLSYDEQRERLLARLDDPTKHWKFREGDIDERRRWDDYMAAYEDAIARCATADAPWYVVPADRKWYRNWAVTRLVLETLEAVDPRYPDPGLDVPALKARLEPPN